MVQADSVAYFMDEGVAKIVNLSIAIEANFPGFVRVDAYQRLLDRCN